LGRTFQRVEICEEMSVRDNIRVGCEARAAGVVPWAQFAASSNARRRIDRAVDESLTRCGLADSADTRAKALSTGRRRLIELARVLAAGFRFLLLDEPSSGLDDAETARFGEILEAAVAELGIGILLVEHDMNLVMGVCGYLHVLDFGQHLFAGDPAATRASDVVRAAYLGQDVTQATPS
jgi:ABC-type branched-subunit amino acid transport system ATPase component